jgi:hypothetical protein
VSDKSDTPESGQGHRFGVTAAMAAATLTLIAAVIGLITVVIDRAGSSDENPAEVTSTFTEPNGGTGGDGGEGATPEGEGPQPTPPRDGNSRSTAKYLVVNRTVEASLAAGNDVDWFVYQAPKDETATIEFVKGGEFVAYGGVYVTVLEGLDEIEEGEVSVVSEPFVFPRNVSAGTRLFVSVEDKCGGGGCGLGPYSLVVRTSPPG